MPNCGSQARFSTNWNPASAGLKRHQVERRGKGDQRRDERDVAHHPLALRAIAAPAGDEHQQRAEQRQEYDCCEQHYRVKYQPRIKTTPMKSDAA